MIQFLEQNWHGLFLSAIFLAVAIVLALVAHYLIFSVLPRFASRKGAVLDQSLIRHGRHPSKWIFPLLAVLGVLPGLPLPPKPMAALEHVTALALIAAIAWLVTLSVDVTADVIADRYRVDVEDNLVARRIQTQFQMLRRITIVLVAIVTVSLMLMTFPAIKHIGLSILASAGLDDARCGHGDEGHVVELD